MEEHRYRVWIDERKQIFEVKNLILTGGEVVRVEVCNGTSGINTEYFDINENDKVMRFVGIKDKKEKEVCEGDIILYQGGTPYEYKAVVRWVDGELAFVWEEGGESDSISDFWFDESDQSLTEVIGNIWENPDLFKRFSNA